MDILADPRMKYILIAVGVALDLVRKIEAQLLVRHYDGFTKGKRRRF